MDVTELRNWLSKAPSGKWTVHIVDLNDEAETFLEIVSIAFIPETEEILLEVSEV